MSLGKETILLIDDDMDVLQAYQTLLELEDYHIIATSDPEEALALINLDWFGVVISDIYMPKMSGWSLLEKVRAKDKDVPVILITGHGDVPMAIEAVKKGAFYFIEKPVDPQSLLNQIAEAIHLRKEQLLSKARQVQELETNFIGKSNYIKKHRSQLQQLSETSMPIFICGEVGTGRFLSAHYLYELAKSGFKNEIIIELVNNCDVNEFKDYFDKEGNNFYIIKNVEYLTNLSQRFLFQFITNNKNSRVIAISQYAIKELLSEFHILPELFYAFSLTQIECIPLSQRKPDIEPLFHHYLTLTCQKLNKRKPVVTAELIKRLLSQRWVGNINQLIYTAELYAVGITANNDQLDFSNYEESEISLDSLIEEYEKKIIIDTLNQFHGKVNIVADYLQIPRKKLYLRMKKYGLSKQDYKK
ncbi:sigma-54-dependent transcriptional regulator [Gallibacterium anatis]|uniref:sigma-54-dependent transcriptional regulator n=1 Tax=Gallibacterium anatis TaxID=750 RepID=UPI0039FDC4F0